MSKINQLGFSPIIILIIVVSVTILAGGSFAAYKFYQSTKSSSPSPSPTPSASPTTSPSASASITATSTPLPTQQPTQAPTPTPTPSPAPQAAIYFNPGSITLDKNRSELNDNIAEVTLYYPGTHKVGIMPANGNVGIYGLFKDTNSTNMEVKDQAVIKIGFSTSYGIKTGENTEVLQLKPGSDLLEIANSSDVLISLPVKVNVKD